ncbi:MAG: hypothetical protein ACJAVI_001403 [Candidatus Azotimanducaceae bacterium]|jgi:hypothetical protein
MQSFFACADAVGTVQVVFINVSAGDAQGDNTARNGQYSTRDGYWLEAQVGC